MKCKDPITEMAKEADKSPHQLFKESMNHLNELLMDGKQSTFEYSLRDNIKEALFECEAYRKTLLDEFHSNGNKEVWAKIRGIEFCIKQIKYAMKN